jgi:hypothetical protein
MKESKKRNTRNKSKKQKVKQEKMPVGSAKGSGSHKLWVCC